MKTASEGQEQAKRRVAFDAAALVRPGMRLGLGSGSTVALIVAALGERVQRGELDGLVVIAASSHTEAAMERAGLRVSSLDNYPRLDLAIDGADEIDGDLQMIKGGGGALLRERIVLAAAAERVIVVDRTKVVPVLGTRWAVPVEVVQFGWRVGERLLAELGAQPSRRMVAGQPMLTDEGNFILDCLFGHIPDPRTLATRIALIPGVVAHGIFVDLADTLLVGDATTTETRRRG